MVYLTSSGSRSALLIIDMLNDFVKEGGALVVPAAAGIISHIEVELKKAREAKTPVIYVNDSHSPDDAEFESWPKHAVEGTWGAEVVKELAPSEGEHVVSKRRYSGFFGTNLDLLLHELDVKTLTLTGTVTNICVYSTALDAYMRGYEIVVVENCIAGLTKEDHETALRWMKELLGARII
ncbi:MAG: isochorismatase family cysteine hydrolase [Actinomycetota bacterium]|nr:isochorismatase family cysteine hydrolase [Actinomycetota bacterium]